MLFNINKKTTFSLLQITGALSLLLIPAFLNMLSLEAAVYCSFTIFMFIAIIRTKESAKISFSMQHSIYAVLIAFGILSLLWSKNTYRHLVYIFSVATVLAFSIMMKDYFAENNSSGLKRRMAYFLSVAGVLCAGVNIIHWLVYIVPVAGNEIFSQGMATGDLLGIFMSLSIVCTIHLFRNNSKIKKALIVIAVLMMLFVFVMAKSFIAWNFAAAVIALLIVKKKVKNTKNSILLFSGIIILYLIAIIFRLTSSVEGKAFSDVFGYSFKNIFGAGGGFWSGRETFSIVTYENVPCIGLLPYLSAAAGVIGLIACILLLARLVVVFIRLKTTESAINLMLSLTVLLLPFGNSIGAILLITGLTVYNESLTDTELKLSLRKSDLKKVLICMSVVTVFSVYMTVLSLVKMSAFSAFSKGQYAKSYEMYKMVSTLNFSDSESYKMAALSIYNDDVLIGEKAGEAIELINKAIEGDELSLENMELKAKIYYNCGDYESSAQEYRNILSKTAKKDKYNLSLVKVLYKIVEGNENGDAENKRAYEEIVLIAQETEDLDLRKEINDIADKAYPYTKGDLNNERENMVE